MDKQALIRDIIEKEWNMFHNVNGEDRASCQEDPRTFEIMRRGQYEAWSEEAVRSYHADLCAAEAEGRNLAREKYIRMMRSTDPAGYEAFRGELPPVSPEKEALAAELWQKYLAQTLRMRERYPYLALGGRPTTAAEEQGWASVETYQTCEALTYSEDTLRALLRHVDALEAQGIDLVFEIQKNSVLGLGFQSMDEAEETMAGQLFRLGGGHCGGCGDET